MMGISKTRSSQTGNVGSSCPLATWTHDKGRDRKPSFSVKIEEGGISKCRCWACDVKGKLSNIAYRYMEYTGDVSAWEYAKSVEHIEWRGKKHDFDESRKKSFIESVDGDSLADEIDIRMEFPLCDEEKMVVERYFIS